MNNQENQIVPDKTPFLSGNGRSYQNLSKKFGSFTAVDNILRSIKEKFWFSLGQMERKQLPENAHRDLHAYFGRSCCSWI
jgi:hypothetical protein